VQRILIGNDNCQYKGFQQRLWRKELVVYSGRDKKLVGELINNLSRKPLKSKYATAIQLKWRLLEEGNNS